MEDKWSPGLGPWTPIIKDGKLYGRGSSDDGYAFFLATIILKGLVQFNLLKNKMVFYFESDEESGSKDIIYFIKKYENLSGKPDLVICLDSGTPDVSHFSTSTTLRGFLEFTLKISMLKYSQNSHTIGGVVADPFRIMREIL